MPNKFSFSILSCLHPNPRTRWKQEKTPNRSRCQNMSFTKEIRLRALPPCSPLLAAGVSQLTHFCSFWLVFTHCKGTASGGEGDCKLRQHSFWWVAGKALCTKTADTRKAADQESPVCVHTGVAFPLVVYGVDILDISMVCCDTERWAVEAFICSS